MTGGIVYVAGPIDFGECGHVSVAQQLADAGFAAFVPQGAWLGGLNAPRGVWDANLKIIQQSVAVLALLPADTRTVGTPVEVTWAATQGVPTFAVGPGLEGSMVLKAWMVRTAATVAGAIQMMKEVFDV